MVQAYHVMSFAGLAFMAGIWSGKGRWNIAFKLAFIGLAGFGAVIVAGDLT